jgi:hypothetical protein
VVVVVAVDRFEVQRWQPNGKQPSKDLVGHPSQRSGGQCLQDRKWRTVIQTTTVISDPRLQQRYLHKVTMG